MSGSPAPGGPRTTAVITRYVAWNGVERRATLLYPRGYRGVLPLVISPHARGGDHVMPRWGDLPGRFGFMCVCPEGHGRISPGNSYAAPGQIDDLATMPDRADGWLPRGLDVARDRIYAIGPSMGGMESLALVGRYPDLLRGALAFDAPTDLAARWVTASAVRRVWIEEEVGARPADAPELYAERSPLGMVDAIAASDAAIWCVYSSEDVASGADPHQVPAFLQALADRRGRVVGARLGTWEHGLGWAQGLDGALRLLDLADASAGRYPGAETRFKPQPQPTAQPPVA